MVSELRPPDESVVGSERVMKQLISASRSLAILDGSLRSIPNPMILVDTVPIQEAVSSSRIENIVSSGDEVYCAITAGEGPIDASTREVVGYRAAIYGCMGKKDTISLVEQICSSVKGKEMRVRGPGQQVFLKGSDGTIVYEPPSGDRVADLLESLLEYMSNGNLDPLIRALVAHVLFESIHPFMDGNGRTGRILIEKNICDAGLLEKPVLYLSGELLRRRRDYYREIRRAQDGRWESYLCFMLDCVERSATRMAEALHSMQDLYIETTDRCRSMNCFSVELMDILFTRVYCKVSFLVDAGIAERNTASKYLKELESAGILSSQKIGRERIYRNIPLMDLFEKVF